MLDTQPISCKSLENFFYVNGKQLEHQYVFHLSDFVTWEQREHAADYVLFEKNLGSYLSIDETSLSQGELYTVITNKEAKGRSGCLVAMIQGTSSDYINKILSKLSRESRLKVKEITLDMAGSMQQIAKTSFPKAIRVTDRFHVQQLASDAVQELRIRYRWDAIEQENVERALSKETGKSFKNERLANGDSLKQLLARSRYLLFKPQHKWTPSQFHRAELLFERFPDLEEAYKLSRELADIYSYSKIKGVAFTKLARWYDKVEKSGINSFQVIKRTIQNHYASILNFFENRSTNASAESFNAKIKALRSQFRGVRNIEFFMFRLSKIYA